jgi:hypothetical protein
MKLLLLFLLIIITCSVGSRASSLSDAYSAALTELVQSGEYNALHLKWFGTAQPNPFPLCTKFYPLTPLADLATVLEKQVVRQGIAVLGFPYSFTTAQKSIDWV